MYFYYLNNPFMRRRKKKQRVLCSKYTSDKQRFSFGVRCQWETLENNSLWECRLDYRSKVVILTHKKHGNKDSNNPIWEIKKWSNMTEEIRLITRRWNLKYKMIRHLFLKKNSFNCMFMTEIREENTFFYNRP